MIQKVYIGIYYCCRSYIFELRTAWQQQQQQQYYAARPLLPSLFFFIFPLYGDTKSALTFLETRVEGRGSRGDSQRTQSLSNRFIFSIHTAVTHQMLCLINHCSSAEVVRVNKKNFLSASNHIYKYIFMCTIRFLRWVPYFAALMNNGNELNLMIMGFDLNFSSEIPSF